MSKTHVDFETESELNLKDVGLWAYAMHPSTDVMCMGVGRRGEPIRVLTPAEIRRGPPDDAWDELLVSAHNAPFEYAIYNLILARRYGWPERWNPSLWRCTMARAAAAGMPLDLDNVGRVLEIKTPKDIEGKKLMLQLCHPNGVDPFGAPTFDRDPQKLARLYQYCGVDVQAEIEVDETLPELPDAEQKVWELDLIMNARGVQIDLEFARKASGMSTTLVEGLNAQLLDLTSGFVDKATRVAAMKEWLGAQGVMVGSLDKEGVTDLLDDPFLNQRCREVLNIRRQVGKKNSIAKYTTALDMACEDGRVRGLLQYHAAHTGRWGGRGLQPQNFPKGFKPKDQLEAITLVKTQPVEALVARYGNKTMDALSDALRGLIVAAPEKELICADFNAIEARVLFWLAGEDSALAAYRRGESPYIEMAQYIFPNDGIPNDAEAAKVSHPFQYDIGKRSILGDGFGMGAPKFKQTVYAETAKMGKAVTISDELAERAVKGYRSKYSRVVSMWYEMERTAINAVQNPTQAFYCCNGKVAWGMTKDRRFLACRLPSGRFLRYWRPSIRLRRTPWGEEKPSLHYFGVDSDTKQWSMQHTYGGSLTENVVQAVARDLIANGMLKAEAAGYKTLLTVHDELLAEMNKVDPYYREGKLKEFCKILCDVPVWAAGCPVTAEGWIGERYRK